MSLPSFSTQSELFSTAGLSSNVFPETDRYRLFARLIYPRLVATRDQLESCYCPDNGRLAIEPVLMLGTSLLQFLEGTSDRAAVEMLGYHAGWNFALNRQLGDELFHPTSLVNFRQRLIEEGLESLLIIGDWVVPMPAHELPSGLTEGFENAASPVDDLHLCRLLNQARTTIAALSR